MAVVIPFALQRRPHEARSCPFPQRTADILFFTGVRYERAADARPQETAAGIRPRIRKPAVRKAARRRPA